MKCPTCESCEYEQYCGATEIMRKCERHNKKVNMTNEEHIHSMNAEELATFLAVVQYDGTDLTLKKNHVEKWVEWLKEKHDEMPNV